MVFQQAADWIGLESRKSLWGQFWSAHQRFFKYLCIAAKVRRLVELAKEELAKDKVWYQSLAAVAAGISLLLQVIFFVVCNQREFIIVQLELKAISNLFKAELLSGLTRIKCSVRVPENIHSKLYWGVNMASSSKALPTVGSW